MAQFEKSKDSRLLTPEEKDLAIKYIKEKNGSYTEDQASHWTDKSIKFTNVNGSKSKMSLANIQYFYKNKNPFENSIATKQENEAMRLLAPNIIDLILKYEKKTSQIVRPKLNKKGHIIPNSFKVYKYGKYRKTTDEYQMHYSVYLKDKQPVAMAPDNEEPMMIEPKNDKANQIDKFLSAVDLLNKSMEIHGYRKSEDEGEIGKFTCFSCRVKPTVAKKFREFCKLMKTTPGKVMCGFVEQVAKDKDLWEEMIKKAKK